jgi:curved DNA-binding protein CbpA
MRFLILLILFLAVCAAKKNYYDVLGVKKSATTKEIKRAARKLSAKWHPDKNQGNDQAEAKFLEVAEALDVLGDAEKREHYDRFGVAPGQEGAGGPRGGRGGFGGFRGGGGGFQFNMNDAENIFSSFFGGGMRGGGGGGGGGRGRGRPQRQPAAQLFQGDSAVKLVSAKTFDDDVRRSRTPVLVQVFGPDCAVCASHEEQYEKVASSAEPFARVMALNAGRSQQLAQELGATSYPTFLLFHKDLEEPKRFSGSDHSPAALLRWLTSEIPSRVKGVATADAEARFLATSPTRPHVVLVSAKASIPAVWRSLSTRFSDKSMMFGFVGGSAPIPERLAGAAESLPAVAVLEPPYFETYVLYDTSKGFTLDKLEAWLRPFARKVYAPPVESFTADLAERRCAPTEAGMCLVAFGPADAARTAELTAIATEHQSKHVAAFTLSQPHCEACSGKAGILLRPKRDKFVWIEEGQSLAAAVGGAVTGSASWSKGAAAQVADILS